MNNNQNLEILEIDNFFPIFVYKELYNLIFQPQTKWVLKEAVTGNKNLVKPWLKNNNVKDSIAFTWDVQKTDQEYDLVSKHVKTFLERKTSYKIKQFGRMLFVFSPPDPSYDHQIYHMTPHVDLKNDYKFYNFLYYFNDNDAETLFFNQTSEKDKNPNKYEKQEIIYKIKPIKNKAVVFNGSIYHAGNVSKYDKRIVLSMHFIAE